MSTKNDLIKSICEKLGYLSEEDAKFALNTMFNYMQENLIKGNRIEFRGFGSFSIRKRKYAGKESYYNTIYYRMPKNVLEKLNPEMNKTNFTE